MNLLKRKTKRGAAPALWLLRFPAGLELRQRRAADWLSRKTQYWNKGSWLVALVLFVVLFGSCCLYLCIKVFIHF
ncbi:hypothetical protein [Mucilaginibacter rubeus]|uniref:Uncharacterized protein n=1 Tax=Mucilaginibacter rubeus TaxID=2027860 RepID=A0A5C1HUR6_9SPHI|nr:hypothetical protein [Mucilaginibacter rubeus]QEM09183.1 hypothetical protein DEO27_003845 [Mucilaginibacter rubeus]